MSGLRGSDLIRFPARLGPTIQPLLLGTFIVISVATFWALFPGRFADFRAFYCSGQAVRSGADPYREHPLHECEHALTSPLLSSLPAEVTVPAPYPGYVLALFAGISALPFTAAVVVWTLAACSALGFAVKLVADATATPLDATLLALAFPATIIPLPLGQPTPFVLLAIAASATLLAAERPRWAALAALGTALDPHIAVALGLALFIGVPRCRLTLVAGLFACIALDHAVLGTAGEIEYLRAVLPAHALANVPEFSQFSAANIAFTAGVSPARAVAIGNLWYAASLVVGVLMGIRLRSQIGPPALAFVPVAFAVFGGAHSHLQQLALATPAFLLVASVAAGARRNMLVAGTSAAFMPWLILVPFPSLYPAVPLVLAAFARSMRTPRIALWLGAASFATLLLLCATLLVSHAQYRPFAPVAGGNPLAQVSWSAYVNASSLPAQDWYVLGKVPTFIAFLALFALLVARAMSPMGLRTLPVLPVAEVHADR